MALVSFNPKLIKSTPIDQRIAVTNAADSPSEFTFASLLLPPPKELRPLKIS